ncbi:hypothetical protein [Streptomyces sp. P3]|uniref:hypothetical protein n=1 Tax=Streptomyces sp. P3 TaxID=2135430 RepID=UPI00131EEE3C|nr:hypothetical protein [Streptomyces sp. P3]
MLTAAVVKPVATALGTDFSERNMSPPMATPKNAAVSITTVVCSDTNGGDAADGRPTGLGGSGREGMRGCGSRDIGSLLAEGRAETADTSGGVVRVGYASRSAVLLLSA